MPPGKLCFWNFTLRENETRRPNSLSNTSYNIESVSKRPFFYLRDVTGDRRIKHYRSVSPLSSPSPPLDVKRVPLRGWRGALSAFLPSSLQRKS